MVDGIPQFGWAIRLHYLYIRVIYNTMLMTTHLVSVFGHSPGPVYNCIRGLEPEAVTLLTTNPKSKKFEGFVEFLEGEFDGITVNPKCIPSLDRPFSEQLKVFKKLKLEPKPTHFLVEAGTSQMVCSLATIFGNDVTPLRFRGKINSNSIELVSLKKGEIIIESDGEKKDAITLQTPALEKVLEFNGLKIKGNNNGRFGMVIKNKYGPNFRCTVVVTDARCKLKVIFQNDRKDGWFNQVVQEAGKWIDAVGAHSIRFRVNGIRMCSITQRLDDLGWKWGE